MKRIIYLGYYLKQLDWSKFRTFFTYAQQQTQCSSLGLLSDLLRSSLRYNISLLDYFYFRFFEKNERIRATYAGTGFMYEYQLKMNPPASRSVLENKLLFNTTYHSFIQRMTFSMAALGDEPTAQVLLDNTSGKIVLKAATGQVGAEVEVFSSSDFTATTLVAFMREKGFDLAEEYVQQHPALNALSPSGLNTVRVISQLDQEGNFHCLGARLRISVNSTVDNMAAGNLAAPIDADSGLINGPAVYSDITKSAVTHHPVTSQEIAGFQVPFWTETMAMVEAAARAFPENRSIGWDVAISATGPELIEGNHNWCKLLWQLPAQQGMKNRLESFL
ncbi:MAG: sugar-transfer associated ATP-grasp domain-containing protein [Bacteroidota bacterium]